MAETLSSIIIDPDCARGLDVTTGYDERFKHTLRTVYECRLCGKCALSFVADQGDDTHLLNASNQFCKPGQRRQEVIPVESAPVDSAVVDGAPVDGTIVHETPEAVPTIGTDARTVEAAA
jgi:hypothetical protein